MWQQKGEDKGRWTEYINPNTGESSIKEHTPKLVWKSCKPTEHYWEYAENPRELECTKCKARRSYTLGYHELKDGQLVEKLAS